jgi:hypothetical protein
MPASMWWLRAKPSIGLREFRRIARLRAALLQYERDERDSFTAAYGDVVRTYAADDTEGLRARALVAFAAFPSARVTRTGHAATQRLDREGLLGRAASSSYLPSTGVAADALRKDLNELFDRYESHGMVRLVTVTLVLTADWRA